MSNYMDIVKRDQNLQRQQEDLEQFQDGDILEGVIIEDMDMQYVDEMGNAVGAEEVVMDDDMELMQEETMEDQLNTHEMVGISREQGHLQQSKQITYRDYAGKDSHHYQQQEDSERIMNMGSTSSPRVFRRAGTTVYRQSYDDYPTPSSSSRLGSMKYPGAQSKPLLPVAVVGSPNRKDWKEEQKKILEIYEIYDHLPLQLRDSFRKMLENSGMPVPPLPPSMRANTRTPQREPPRRIQQPQHLQRDDSGHVPLKIPLTAQERRIRQQLRAERAAEARDYPVQSHEVEEEVMFHSRQREDNKKVISELEDTELGEMPELVEEVVVEDTTEPVATDSRREEEMESERGENGRGQGDLRRSLLEAQQERTQGERIDVEGYEDEAEYVYDEAGNLMNSADIDKVRSQRYVIPEMREQYFAVSNMPRYPVGANKMMPVSSKVGETRYCGGCKMFLKKTVFYHHNRMIKKYGVCNMFTPRRFPCSFEGCTERVGTVEKLCEHLYQIHGAPTQIKRQVFHCEEAFDVFLSELEGKGGNFRMSRGNKRIKLVDGMEGTVQYYRCNRMLTLPKEKTLRTCDEIANFASSHGDDPELQFTHVANFVRDQGQLQIREREREDAMDNDQNDPFVTMGTKALLRTEVACTAFFRKTYMPNGDIEVRYCDHHLHDDERIRLPFTVKERIYDMNSKGLPAAVMIMVLQKERLRYCTEGSAIDRRLMGLTARDISNVLTNRHNRVRKRKRGSLNGRPIAMLLPPDVRDYEPQTRTLAKVEHESDVIPKTEPPNEASEQSSDVCGVAAKTGVVGNLTELEQSALEEYESNLNIILTDYQKSKRNENRKRHLRDHVRTKAYRIGRFLKMQPFVDMGHGDLEDLLGHLNKATLVIDKIMNKNDGSFQHEDDIDAGGPRSRDNIDVKQEVMCSSHLQSVDDHAGDSESHEHEEFIDVEDELLENRQDHAERLPPKRMRGRPRKMAIAGPSTSQTGNNGQYMQPSTSQAGNNEQYAENDMSTGHCEDRLIEMTPDDVPLAADEEAIVEIEDMHSQPPLPPPPSHRRQERDSRAEPKKVCSGAPANSKTRPIRVKTQSLATVANSASTEEVADNGHNQELVEESTPATSSAKRVIKRRGRPPTGPERVRFCSIRSDSDSPAEQTNEPESAPPTPSTTRTGRVVKPRIIKDF